MKGKKWISVLVMVVVAMVVMGINWWHAGAEKSPEVLAEVLPAPEPRLQYELPVDSFFIVRDKVKKNQFLADILVNKGVDYNRIDQMVKVARPVFDVRKIRVGNPYALFMSNDSLQRVQYFIYEKSPSKYVVFDFSDSLKVYHGEKEIVRQPMVVSGMIESSLWNSLVANGGDPNLANELSEIYQWTIDFFGIQKNDQYRIYYEKLFVEEHDVGIGKVLASEFIHMNDTLRAFYFEEDSIGDYFDEKGESLRRTFLKAPLRYSRISSRFSNSRLHPVLKIRRPHHGIDYAAPTGTPVVSIGDGTVIKKGYQKRGGGNYVKIKHNGTYSTTYMHLSKFGRGIQAGVRVKQGQVIGYVGKTGLATGPHLDFRVYKNGHPMDPLKMKSPAAKPVDSASFHSFILVADSLKNLLEGRN